jgi:hypothetical protein
MCLHRMCWGIWGRQRAPREEPGGRGNHAGACVGGLGVVDVL